MFKYDYNTGKYRFISPQRGREEPPDDLTKDLPGTPPESDAGSLFSPVTPEQKLAGIERALGYSLTREQKEKALSVLMTEPAAPKPSAYELYQNYRGNLYKAFPPGIMSGDEYVRQPQPTLQQVQDVRKYSGLDPLAELKLDDIDKLYQMGIIGEEEYIAMRRSAGLKASGMLPAAGRDLRMSEYESGSLGLAREREAREGREFDIEEGRLGEEFKTTEGRLQEELDWRQEVAESNRLLEEAKFAHKQAQDNALLAIQQAQYETDREYKQALIENAQAQLAETKRQFEIAEARARRAQVLAEQQAKQQAISQWTQLYGYGPNWAVRGAPGAGGITSEDVAKMASSSTGWR